ncbi:hypothetical protein TNCV_1168481 [Trichonephila clavipes]|uniref:Uncharacterized protein n=1 Tax=Trichonephila clavipes TaxID=2585209 RepID=A0A8X6SX96_TRICX|nr:hypothetical protein TNCV_1168481 [Trichonephila clavipes]
MANSLVTHVVSRSFEHHTGDRTIYLGFTPMLREKTLEVVRTFPPLFLHQPHERTCSSTAILSTLMQRRHYTFTKIHVFSGILTPAQWHGCQRR